MVVTGSGSTGILMSAIRPRISELPHLHSKTPDVQLEQLKKIQQSLRFKGNDSRFYYFNRELSLLYQNITNFDDRSLKTLSLMEEGFWEKRLQITNLNLKGNILLDGNLTFTLEYGDEIDIKQGTSLKWVE